jgi:dynein heavy chain
VRPYLEKDNFVPEVVKKASKAAFGLCCWIRAMESYDKVAQVQIFVISVSKTN